MVQKAGTIEYSYSESEYVDSYFTNSQTGYFTGNQFCYTTILKQLIKEKHG